MAAIMQAVKEETMQIASMTTSTMTRRTLMTEAAPAMARTEAAGGES